MDLDPTRREGVNPDRWRRIEAAFHHAIELDGTELDAYLGRTFEDEPSLRREVERLLAHDTPSATREQDSFGRVLEQAAGQVLEAVGADLQAEDSASTDTITGYQLLEVLGEGGMGTVYRAEQQGPIRRTVALKLIRPGLGEMAQRRFDAERQALARMQHPSIAQVFEAGWTKNRRPYVAMELVDGEHITDYCDQRRLALDARLELFAGVCRAVQHAHQKGVLHRDLKPSNILVTAVAGRPVPKIIDFGIAKSLGAPLTEQTLMTGEALLGTPGYLSPEALQGAEVDTRGDIYALGAVLYRLLLGVLPFDETVFSRLMQRQMTEDPPSLRQRGRDLDTGILAQHAALRRCGSKALLKSLDGELDWIVSRALARQLQQRYASAAELADDIERFLRHEPVQVGPSTAEYRLRKLLRRNRLAFAMAGAVVLALGAAFVARSLEAQRANQEAERARQAAQATQQVSEFLVDLFAVSGPVSDEVDAEGTSWRWDDAAVRRTLELESQRIDGELAEEPRVQARMLHVLAGIYRHLGELERARGYAERSVDLRRQELGDGHPDVAASRQRLRRIEDALSAPKESPSTRSTQDGPEDGRPLDL